MDHASLDTLIDEEPVQRPSDVFDRYDPAAIMRGALAAYERKLEEVHAVVGSDPDPDTPEGKLARLFLKEAHTTYMMHEAHATRFVDPTSGLLTRETLVRELLSDLGEVSNGARPDLGIYAIDLNNLKFVNDTRGHAAGDGYIEAAGKALKRFSPKGFKPGRAGGDELVMIAPIQSEPEQDTGIIKLSLTNEIEAFARTLGSDNLEYPLGAAVGYGSIDRDAISRLGERPSLATVLELSGADRAMYAEKEKMKNGESYR